MMREGHINKGLESISVKDFYDSFQESLKLNLVTGAEGLSKFILEKSINRPALALTGYLKHFAFKRIQLFGAGEMSYMRDLEEGEQIKVLEDLVSRRIPCMVVSRNLLPTKSMITVCKKHDVALFRTPLNSKDFIAEATILLEEHMAPWTSLHGTLLDVRGIGTLLRGGSGVGKSECALALIERGNSLVADDLIRVKLLAEGVLVGQGTELGRGYLECRGLGVLNIAELFGIRALRMEKSVDFVISFLESDCDVEEDRTGLDQKYFNILGQRVPHVEIMVRPGRDLARLVETATLVHALKLMGHNSAEIFNQKLIDSIKEKSTKDVD